MKSFFVYMFLLPSLCGVNFAYAKDKAKFAVLSLTSPEQFELKQRALMKDAGEDSEALLLSFKSANAETKGNLKVDDKVMIQAIESLPADISVLYVDFNFRMQENFKSVLEVLNQRAEKGLLIVGSAGVAQGNEVSVQVNRSFLGQLKKVILIGELTERERLIPGSFYGPELMTAVKPPREWIGQGYAPILFASRLASQNQRHHQEDWMSYLAAKKAKTKKLWADLEDFFPR